MSKEIHRHLWDAVYVDLISAQDRAMSMFGDEKAAEFYRIVGEARREAERIAPAGWSPVDLRVLPLLSK